MGFKPFEKKVWLSSPTMHGEELKYMQEAYETNWMSTVGKNINEVTTMPINKARDFFRELELTDREKAIAIVRNIKWQEIGLS